MAKLADLIQADKPQYTGAAAVYPYSVELQKKFTLTSRFGDVYKCYERRGDKILLPRAVCPLGEDRRSLGRPIKAATRIKPRNPEQARVIKEASDRLADGQSFILQAGTGFGKTVCSLEIAASVKRTVLVVVPKEDLYNQWLEAIKKFWLIPTSRIGQIRQDVCDVVGKDIVVAMLHSLCIKDRYPLSAYNSYGLVIFDEVHRIAADSFMTICNKVPAKLRLGLSATPERKDGKDVALYAHIGPIAVKTDMVQLAPKVLRYYTNWKVPRVKTKNPLTGDWAYQKMHHTPGKTMHLFKRMAKDPERNAMILKFIKASYRNSRDIVVFTDLRDHVDLLMNLSVKEGIPMSDMSPYVSGMKKQEVENAKTKRVRFATWGMMGEGTDIPWMDTCILAMPRSNVEQPVGRILREHEGKKEPVVFDLIDNDSSVFAGYANKRVSFYKRKQAIIKTMA